eukprot:SAG31_NODE_7473_length_1680_cov_2.545225_2_plen_147_part_00
MCIIFPNAILGSLGHEVVAVGNSYIVVQLRTIFGANADMGMTTIGDNLICTVSLAGSRVPTSAYSIEPLYRKHDIVSVNNIGVSINPEALFQSELRVQLRGDDGELLKSLVGQTGLENTTNNLYYRDEAGYHHATYRATFLFVHKR